MLSIPVKRPVFDSSGKSTGVETVTVPISVKFNTYAGEYVSKVKGTGIGQPTSGNAMAVLWSGYMGWCYAKQVDPELTFEEITDYIEENDENEDVLNFIKDATKKFTDSQYFTKLIKRTQPDEKKSPENLSSGTNSTPTHGENSD